MGGTIYWDATTGTYTIDDGQGGRRAITGEQATRYAAQGWQIHSPTTVGQKNPDGSPIGGGNPVYTPPASPAPPSYNPLGGQPTYTPGISFGQGTIPGQGDTYQRSWFDIGSGTPEGVAQKYYDDPSNWNFAWDKVLNQFGGQVGGDFYKFLQGFSSTARGDYQGTSSYDPNLHVANFLDQYAPQIKGVFGLLPSSQTHGGTGGIAGRATY